MLTKRLKRLHILPLRLQCGNANFRSYKYKYLMYDLRFTNKYMLKKIVHLKFKIVNPTIITYMNAT